MNNIQGRLEEKVFFIKNGKNSDLKLEIESPVI